MKNEIEKIKKSALEEISKLKNFDELEKLRVKYLGRKSELIGVLRVLKDMPEAERKKNRRVGK